MVLFVFFAELYLGGDVEERGRIVVRIVADALFYSDLYKRGGFLSW